MATKLRIGPLGVLASALILGCGSGAEGVGGDSSAQDTTAAGEETTGSPADPLPPRPDSIRCNFEGTAPGLLPPVVVAPLSDELAGGAVDLAVSDDVLYVATGDLRILALDPDGTPRSTVVDLADRAARLVSLALADDHAQTGHLYVRYEASTGAPRAVIARWTLDPSTTSAVAGSEIVVMEIEDAVGERSGGALAFGPDGLLYLGVGALASEATQGLAQEPTSRLGKLLRVDVSTLDVSGTYAIPADNPFMGLGGASDEVWARGLRDPWRCSFAADDPQPWCVDGGENQQEIDHVAARMNLGWPDVDGTACLLVGGDCSDLQVDAPLAAYRSVDGDCGISGVVLGSSSGAPELEGALIYPDRCSGRLRGLDTQSEEVLIQDEVMGVAEVAPSAIAQDAQGRIFVLSAVGVGEVLVPPAVAEFPTALSASGCFDDLTTLTPAPGLVPYGVNAALWSDGSVKDRFLVIPPGRTITVNSDGTFEFPIGSVIIKLFAFDFVAGDPSSRRAVEARVMVRREFGWQFHSYRFDDAASDATLLSTSHRQQLLIDDGGEQLAFEYSWPSRASCKVCHGLGASNALGPRQDQLDGDFDYGTTVANQLDALAGIGLFSGPLPVGTPPIPAFDDPAVPVEQRARAYLHANCGHCHRPGGWTPAGLTLDLRYSTPLLEAQVCNVPTQYFNPWVTSEVRIAPGDPEGSVIWQRLNLRGLGQMPPLATARIDPGAEVVAEWIASLAGCPS